MHSSSESVARIQQTQQTQQTQHRAVVRRLGVNSWRNRRCSADANRTPKRTLRVDDLATLARGHPLTEASGADFLDTADLVRVMHSEGPSEGTARVSGRLRCRKVAHAKSLRVD